MFHIKNDPLIDNQTFDIFYNGVDVNPIIKNKLGRKFNMNYWTMADVKYEMTVGAFVFYAPEEVYIVWCESKSQKVISPYKLDFSMKKSKQ